MASGTVGYTDTRGNKDYSSIIANQIGRRLKEASNMASEERAYAAGMAEAGGTSLEEAGIGKGYFFGRALGSRFGGDRIARTRGRMGASGAATNPASNYKQRFRGGFDYKVTNQVLTDTIPISNALVTGLRGVEQGLSDVAGAIQRQDNTLGSLSRNQADMAKAIMFNGYLFQMFASQQRANAGRASARREERSMEGGFAGGMIGGASFGGAGGGRGMINVTGGGTSGGGARGGARGGYGGGGSSLTNFGLTDVASFATGRVGGKLTEGAITFTPQVLRRTAASLTGTPFNVVSNRTVLEALAGGRISEGLQKVIDTPLSPQFMRTLGTKAGLDGIETTIEAIGQTAAKGGINQSSAKMLQAAIRGADTGKSTIISEMLDAQIRAGKRGVKVGKDVTSNITGILGEQMGIGSMVRRSVNEPIYRDLNAFKASGMTKKQSKILFDLGLSPGDFDSFGELIPGTAVKGGIVDDILKYYPGAKFKNIEEAVALTQYARYLDSGMKPRKAIAAVRNLMGAEVADKALVAGSRLATRNTMVGKSLARVATRNAMLRSIAKKIPVISAIAGVGFGIQRALEGDLKGAALEVGSGFLGLFPGLGTKASFGLDAYMLGRDLGVFPMRTGGRMSGFAKNSLLSVNGMPLASFNEPGNPESIVVERNEDRSSEMGENILKGFKKKKSDYIALQASGVESALSGLKSGGFFGNMFDTVKDTVNTTKNILPNLNPFSGVKNWFNKGYSPKEDTMKWKDLLADDWKQRGKFGKGGKLGGWDLTRGFRPGVSAKEGGFMSGPTPAGRQAVKRGFGFLSSFRGGALTTMLSLIANDFINPQPLADGTMDGYMKSIGQNNSMQLQNENVNPIATTVINNNYYNGGGQGGGQESGNENLGQGFNDDLTKFINMFSIMTK